MPPDWDQDRIRQERDVHSWGWKRVLFQQRVEPLPRHPAPLTSPLEPLEPRPSCLPPELPKAAHIPAHPEICVVPSEPLTERGVLLRYRMVPVAPTPVADVLQGHPEFRLAEG